MPDRRFRPNGDTCLSIFRDIYETGALVFPPRARVLEIGCAEADWMTPMLASRPDLQIVGIDWRRCERPGVMTIKGDVLVGDFPNASFDVVVGISSIEHIGLGHYERDPVDDDGDVKCMQRVARWLRPGGWFYADVPFGETYGVEGTSHRVYDAAHLQQRLFPSGLTAQRHWYTSGEGDIVDTPAALIPGRFQYVAVWATKDRQPC